MNETREEPETRTEEELAQVRQARFGHLPARVRPEDLVESEDTDRHPDEPAQPMVRREWA
jgi:hypothetical protein